MDGKIRERSASNGIRMGPFISLPHPSPPRAPGRGRGWGSRTRAEVSGRSLQKLHPDPVKGISVAPENLPFPRRIDQSVETDWGTFTSLLTTRMNPGVSAICPYDTPLPERSGRGRGWGSKAHRSLRAQLIEGGGNIAFLFTIHPDGGATLWAELFSICSGILIFSVRRL